MLESWRCLHRVSSIDWDDWGGEPADKITGYGRTVCGVEGRLAMPGILSRMGLPRCARCCDFVGIPRGDGAPFNEGMREH